MKLQACVFSTPIGWLGLVGADKRVWRLTIGHRRSEEAWSDLRKHFAEESLIESDWFPKLKKMLEQFAAGKVVSFADVVVRIDHRTEFQQRVLAATQTIGFGEAISYGKLAELVGSPKAARAVGAVMASNQIPIIIPCHRVLGSRGELTGFSAPTGLDLKQRLLDLEQAALNGK
jgi:methylated-DNA-[protein]-cysteine S-methyltransferase